MSDSEVRRRRRILMIIAGVVFGAAFLLVAGNYLYWVGSGRPGTPEEFRERVANTGLEVDWTNNGPTGGDGTVRTDCGPVEVTVNELDGELRLFVDGDRGRLGPEVIRDLLACQ